MQSGGRASGTGGAGGEESAGDEGGREAFAFEPGVHRSVYGRAFGPLSDVGFDHGRVPAPWPQHSDLFDEHEQEEMLYRRQMALAAQDRARSVSLPRGFARVGKDAESTRPRALARPHGLGTTDRARHHAFAPGTTRSRPPACECARRNPPDLTVRGAEQIRVLHRANGRGQQALPPHSHRLPDAPDARVRLPDPVLESKRA